MTQALNIEMLKNNYIGSFLKGYLLILPFCSTLYLEDALSMVYFNDTKYFI